jgi:hypothetical protein
MRKVTLVLCAVLLGLCVTAQASMVSDFATTALMWAKDTITAPGGIGVSVGDDVCLDFSRQWDLKNLWGLTSVEANGGIAFAQTGPGVRAFGGITLGNAWGNQLIGTVRTDASSDSTWQVDLGPLGHFGLTPTLEIQRAF